MDTHANLPEPITALLDSALYPHPVDEIVLVQTHISYVVLAGEYVYKLRKPVDFGFLDFSTPRKRLNDCVREIELNSRLCPGLYLGVVRLRHDGRRYSLDGPGRVVEYAVKMHRLPQERMMDALLATGELSVEMVEELAQKIAAFHALPPAKSVARYGSLRVIRRNWEENFAQTAAYVGRTIAPQDYRLLQDWVRVFMRRERRRFEHRVRTGRIRDGHGDLRASAVCYANGICVFDCIEFNNRFRYGDVAADIAFLVMDLSARGRPDLAAAFAEHYQAVSGDTGLAALLPFYACYRAYVRGKVESFRLDEREVSTGEKAQAVETARAAFALASDYARRHPMPLLVIVSGLSGTGKSALAHILAPALGAELFASDQVRKELAGIGSTTHRNDPYGAGIYTPRFTARTHAELFRRAGAALAAGRSVILDATFIARTRRDQARRLAQQAGAHVICIECRASEAVVRARLQQRADEPGSVSDARWDTYLAQRRAQDPIDELDAWQHLPLDLDQPLQDCASRALADIRARFGWPAD